METGWQHQIGFGRYKNKTHNRVNTLLHHVVISPGVGWKIVLNGVANMDPFVLNSISFAQGNKSLLQTFPSSTPNHSFYEKVKFFTNGVEDRNQLCVEFKRLAQGYKYLLQTFPSSSLYSQTPPSMRKSNSSLKWRRRQGPPLFGAEFSKGIRAVDTLCLDQLLWLCPSKYNKSAEHLFHVCRHFIFSIFFTNVLYFNNLFYIHLVFVLQHLQ